MEDAVRYKFADADTPNIKACGAADCNTDLCCYENVRYRFEGNPFVTQWMPYDDMCFEGYTLYTGNPVNQGCESVDNNFPVCINYVTDA